MRQPIGPLLAVAAVGVVLWLIVAVLIRLARRPRSPDADPATMELRPEPPAVAGMVAADFEVTHDSLPATLLDLAARGAVEIEQQGDDTFVTLRDGGLDLLPHEARVLAHVRHLATGGGRVPAAALTTGPQDTSRGWWRSFRKEVMAEARRRGLARPVWDGQVRAGLATALLVLGLLFWASVRFDFDTVEATPLFVVTLIAMIVAAVVAAAVLASDRQRDTALGREAAAHWLGFREHHEANEVIPTLPPAAVAVRGRYLAYCAALGQATDAVRALPLGAEDDERAWTNYGGRWRHVRVRYPRFRPGWGRNPWLALVVGLIGTFAAGNMLRGAVAVRDANHPDLGDYVESIRRAGDVFSIAALLILVWFATQLVLAVLDVVSPDREVKGKVIRRRDRAGIEFNSSRQRGGRNWYLAVDVGRGDRIVAYSVTRVRYDEVGQGDDVVATVTWPLRHVRSLHRS